jgi:hypothetical protein
MKRSSPTWPDPDGGPPPRGCLYMSRFAWLGLGLFWLALWFAFPLRKADAKLGMMSLLAVPFLVVVGVPLANLAERLEIRRYCRARGFTVVKLQWRGVVYMDGDIKRYSRWPDDFRRDPHPPADVG